MRVFLLEQIGSDWVQKGFLIVVLLRDDFLFGVVFRSKTGESQLAQWSLIACANLEIPAGSLRDIAIDAGDPEAYLPEDNGDRPLLVTGGLLAKAFGKALKHHEGHVEETIGVSEVQRNGRLCCTKLNEIISCLIVKMDYVVVSEPAQEEKRARWQQPKYACKSQIEEGNSVKGQGGKVNRSLCTYCSRVWHYLKSIASSGNHQLIVCVCESLSLRKSADPAVQKSWLGPIPITSFRVIACFAFRYYQM